MVYHSSHKSLELLAVFWFCVFFEDAFFEVELSAKAMWLLKNAIKDKVINGLLNERIMILVYPEINGFAWSEKRDSWPVKGVTYLKLGFEGGVSILTDLPWESLNLVLGKADNANEWDWEPGQGA